MIRHRNYRGIKTMTARIDSLQRTVSVFGAVLFTIALVAFSAPIVPLA